MHLAKSTSMDNSINQIQNKKMKIHKCEICDKEFKNNQGLKKHFNIIHNLEKKHQCNICQKVFKFHSELILHVKIAHENKKHFKCDLCEKAFQYCS